MKSFLVLDLRMHTQVDAVVVCVTQNTAGGCCLPSCGRRVVVLRGLPCSSGATCGLSHTSVPLQILVSQVRPSLRGSGACVPVLTGTVAHGLSLGESSIKWSCGRWGATCKASPRREDVRICIRDAYDLIWILS